MTLAIVVPHPSLPEAYNLTSEGYRKLKIFAGFLSPLFESYRVVLAYFQQTAAERHEPPQRLKHIQSLGTKMYKRQAIVCKEALSKINYLNAVDYCLNGEFGGGFDDMQIGDFVGIRYYPGHQPKGMLVPHTIRITKPIPGN